MIDITRTVHAGMAVYPGNPGVEVERVQRAGGGKNTLSRVALGTHTGTHIDAPAHVHDGEMGALAYPLEQLCGPAEVVDLSQLASVITATDIPPTRVARVLFKTRNSAGDPGVFDEDFVALDDSAASELVRRGVRLVGLDALSIRKRGMVNRVHETFIDAGIVILEGLWLAEAVAGRYELICLPIKWDLDGAPVRAVLRFPSPQVRRGRG
ncbi:MAG: cyclase family protein [Candidatus Andersenbacteria bacterium]|nr:cyclase family protein [Candidatus Andersenbacteria bacterium]